MDEVRQKKTCNSNGHKHYVSKKILFFALKVLVSWLIVTQTPMPPWNLWFIYNHNIGSLKKKCKLGAWFYFHPIAILKKITNSKYVTFYIHATKWHSQ